MHGFLATPGFGWIATIIIGAIAGWLAERITKSDHGLLANIVIGIAGSAVGVYLLRQFNIFPAGGWIWTILVATGGAVLLITVWNAITGRK
jgi:uncharacterized membrane protein YeaQ/YmgE (transglycosylase-associated protein family)